MATCFGGGGAFGYGFDMGIADGMRDGGVDVGRFPMIGTSAGSHTAATIDTGLGFEHVADLWERFIEGQGRRFMVNGHELADPIYGGREATDVTAIAVRMRSWRRVSLSSNRHHLADIVAASSAVPPLVRPHVIDGRRYLDGGVISMASIDLTPGADLLLAITPFAVAGQGAAGRVGALQARREIRKWSKRHRGSVLHIVPSEAMAAVGGKRLDEVGDMAIGRRVYPMAVEMGRHVADVVLRDHPGVRLTATTAG